MKTTVLLALLGLLSCTATETTPTDNTVMATAVPSTLQPINYIVLLDLSDRLLTPNQVSTDIALITHVFDRFRDIVVKKKFVIQSKDRFQVVIAPQQDIGFAPTAFMDSLSLDLSAHTTGSKSLALEQMERRFGQELRLLYTKATRNRTTSAHFAGSDLWRYFNEQLPHVLVPDADNRLIVLTDGYLDFNNPTFTRCEGNRCTSTSKFLASLRKNSNWSTLIANGTWGILPPKKKFTNLSAAVMEIQSKSTFQEETVLLEELWQKWLGDMGTSKRVTVPHAALSMSKKELDSFFE